VIGHHHRRGAEPAPAIAGSGAAAAPAGAAADKLPPGTGIALFAIGLGVIVIANDFTAMNVAIPAIEHDFDIDLGTAQWVVNAYALIFGMAIVTGGRLADMFGRRKIFFVGAAIFAGFSLLGGLAPNATTLIVMRLLMGVGGALMWPALLGLTYAILPDSKAGLAGGLILGAAGIGNAMGPMLGGFLTDEISWRAIFFLNLPIAAFAAAVVAARVPKDASGAREGIDYPGIATLSVGLILLLLGFDQAADWGFGDVRVIAMFVVAVLLIGSFALIEPRMGERALVPRDVIRNANFRAACITVLLLSAVFFAAILYVPQFMIEVLGYSPLEAGVGMVPMLGVFAVTSFIAGRFYDRLGAKRAVTIGVVGIVIGIGLLAMMNDDWEYENLIPGLVVLGLGCGVFYSSVTTAGVTSLDPSRTSLAGGIVYMFQVAGGAIGLGITTTIFTITSEDELAEKAAAAGTSLTEHQSSVMHGLLAGTETASAAASSLDPSKLAVVEEIVRDSFVTGIASGFRYVAILAVASFFVSLFFVGGPLRRRHGGEVGAG
jgi:EmrB/QacA subfamily drug resistance transporter